jgi:DNA-binding NarL/FixJ family response regulator
LVVATVVEDGPHVARPVSVGDVVHALCKLPTSGAHLTPMSGMRDGEILVLTAYGLSNVEIADRLYIKRPEVWTDVT